MKRRFNHSTYTPVAFFILRIILGFKIYSVLLQKHLFMHNDLAYL